VAGDDAAGRERPALHRSIAFMGAADNSIALLTGAAGVLRLRRPIRFALRPAPLRM